MTSTSRPRRSTVPAIVLVVMTFAVIASPSPAAAAAPTSNALLQSSAAIEALVQQARGSVVQVAVTGYREGSDGLLSRSRSIGSGAIIDPHGLIVTNAHVIAGAERIDVVLTGQNEDGPPLGPSSTRTVPARLMGVAPELDLALLAIDVDGLPALRLADSSAVRQGELVFALGSPAGLRNSVSMGVVSAAARQVQPDTPIAYIQTDTAINPGNSGGPLLNQQGELVGLNTFIQSMSGGNEGLGFALPAAIIALAYPQLRDFGHLHRASTGMALQTLTPALRDGLGLSRENGFIVADLADDGPAARGGVQVGDVIAEIDGRAVESLTFVDLYRYIYAAQDGQRLALDIERGRAHVHVDLVAKQAAHACERPALVDTHRDLIEPLGVFGQTMATEDAPEGEGVVVTNRVDSTAAEEVPLQRGDLIRSLNGLRTATVAALRERLGAIGSGQAIVLQVFREGQLTFVGFRR